MKNTLDTMKEVLTSTYKQIEENLPSGEYLISYLTVYDKKNAVSTNIFLTSQAIFLQESNELEKIKKRKFDKISDVKLTATEFYMEFVNGHTIVGDIKDSLLDAERFFNDIKANTHIRASSVKDLQTSTEIEEKPVLKRKNQFISDDGKADKPTINTPVQSLVSSYNEPDETKKPVNGKKIGIIVGISLLVIAIIAGITWFAIDANNKKKAEEELKNRIASIETRTDEILKYQLATNEMYDYIFELQGYYDEISLTQATINLSTYELGLRDLQNDFEDKYSKKFTAKSDAYVLYKVEKVTGWMNKNRTYVEDALDLFSDCLDGNFKSESKMLELKKLLEDADSEIKKVQQILAEEKEELNKAYEKLTGKKLDNAPKEDKKKDDKKDKDKDKESTEETDKDTEKKDEENTEEVVNPNADEEGFVDENDKNAATDVEVEQGRQDEDAYTGE